MLRPTALVLRAPGTNCDRETAHAFEMAGAHAERIHVNCLMENPGLLERFQILCLPGGFSYGDDIAAGKILAKQMRLRIGEDLQRFREGDNLILGICNGFQVLIKSGLLIDGTGEQADATLTWNERGLYDDRWVHLQTGNTNCVFLRGLDRLYLPIAHAEGRFVVRDGKSWAALQQSGQVAIRYAPTPSELASQPRSSNQIASQIPDAPSSVATAQPAIASAPLAFPFNPNGSYDNIAGICDPSGKVFGLMPHPERFVHWTQHPRWTRSHTETDQRPDGLRIFRNAVEFFA